MFLYETHMHTCQGSRCGVSTGREHARLYHERGYQGIIITDHFLGGNTAVDRSLPWREQMNQFCSGYEDALNEGIRLGLDVFFGWEETFDGDDYLVYGLDKAWLIEHPEVSGWTRAEQLRQVHAYGGCVVQAHPFRQRGYLSRILLGLRFADAVEVANAGNDPFSDACALRYAQENGQMMTAGSDNHRSFDGQTLMGVGTKTRLHDIRDYVRLILNKQPLHLQVPDGRFDFPSDSRIYLPGFMLTEDENTSPYHRPWLPEEKNNQAI